MTEKKYSQRGFRIYLEEEPNEPNNRKLLVIQSSLVATGAKDYPVYPVRIFGGIEEDGHVHLDLEQAKKASDTLRAVAEHGLEMCVGYKDDGGTLLKYPECTRHGPCKVKMVCRAWRGTQREKKDEEGS